MKALLSWSSGKDSAYALATILKDKQFEIAEMFTTISETYGRVAIHGVREELLDLQALAIGLPLHKIHLPSPCLNAVYEERLSAYLKPWAKKGVTHVIFGDLFLEDIRAYRVKQLAALGMEGVFPLWKMETRGLAKKMIVDGFKAHLTCVDLKKLSKEFAGKPFDQKLLSEFPVGIDPCGENGEFHTFVYQAPFFKKQIPVKVGKTVEREGFAFADLLVERELQNKVCESCGAVFPCQPGNCWCDNVSLEPGALKKIEEKFKDCICEKCLGRGGF